MVGKGDWSHDAAHGPRGWLPAAFCTLVSSVPVDPYPNTRIP